MNCLSLFDRSVKSRRETYIDQPSGNANRNADDTDTEQEEITAGPCVLDIPGGARVERCWRISVASFMISACMCARLMVASTVPMIMTVNRVKDLESMASPHYCSVLLNSRLARVQAARISGRRSLIRMARRARSVVRAGITTELRVLRVC